MPSVQDIVLQKHFKQLIYTVLTSPGARKIDFWLGSVHVDEAGFRSVIDAIDCGSIKIVVEPQPTGALASYSGAQFSFPNATFGLTPKNRSAILHEAVHAIQDIAGGTIWSPRGSVFTTETENEAAAYVAGALLDIYEGRAAPAAPPQYPAAALIAGMLKDVKGGAVSELAADSLRLIIATRPVYHDNGVTYSSPTISAGGIDTCSSDAPELPPDPGPVHVVKMEDAVLLKVAGDELFDFGKSVIKPEALAALNKAAAEIRAHPGWRVSVEGHTDSIGDAGTNVRLSDQRALAVKNWLIAHKSATAGDVTTKGWGKSQPVQPNNKPSGADNPAGRALNRRVEIWLKRK